MQLPPRDQVESVLAELVKESLVRREPVRVPGLGTFAVRHEKSVIERSESGEIVVVPPRDEVTFAPEWGTGGNEPLS